MPIPIIIQYVQYVCQTSLFQAKDSSVSRDHVATLIAIGCLFFMLKIVKKNLGIAKTMFWELT